MARRRSVRRIARRDSNHSELVEVFESLGATWFDTSNIGGGLDGLLGVSGIDQRVEIKDGAKFLSRRRLTKDEDDTFQEWRGRPPVVVETVDDAINLVNKLRKEACHAGTKI
jgi:hypothetical protein